MSKVDILNSTPDHVKKLFSIPVKNWRLLIKNHFFCLGFFEEISYLISSLLNYEITKNHLGSLLFNY